MELELKPISSYIEKISKKKGPNSILFKVEEVYIVMGENIRLHLWKIISRRSLPSQLQL
jgi:hypothetical protein